MRASPIPLRHLATALGLVLPLLAVPASADPRAWVDPPKSSPPEAAAPKPAAPAEAHVQAADRPTKAADTAPRPPRARAAGRAEARARVAAVPKPPHRAPRTRLADTPAMGPTVAPTAAPAPAGRVEAAQALAMDYLSVVSAPGEAMVGAAPRFYGTRVRFYGRRTTLAALLDEKRGFVRRWPERRYAARAFSTQCSPDGTSCIVRTIVDFSAANPQRGAVSRGASELVLEVSFAGQRPVIVAESGRVLHRDGRGQERAETLAPGAGRG
ncbi:hypothetical protein [Methylobacterium sp. J-076]|uniref:hypothetical protein n=1 Tax=Methylobacterium sp. J-076 TaxID=2836655 RepID=UPI001FBB60BD|nr:hypothetical protein [Methylobacterium sp. J-076]MCJ2014804.1 hypothetical protein [Methylobacterium sp. J-076]